MLLLRNHLRVVLKWDMLIHVLLMACVLFESVAQILFEGGCCFIVAQVVFEGAAKC